MSGALGEMNVAVKLPPIERFAISARRRSATRASAPAPEMGLMIATTFTIHFIAALNLKRYDLAAAMLDEDLSRIGPDGRDTIALHLSVSKQNVESVRWLIEHGVDIDAKRPMWDCNSPPCI